MGTDFTEIARSTTDYHPVKLDFGSTKDTNSRFNSTFKIAVLHCAPTVDAITVIRCPSHWTLDRVTQRGTDSGSPGPRSTFGSNIHLDLRRALKSNSPKHGYERPGQLQYQASPPFLPLHSGDV
jgi:hypothetical protein